MAIKNQQLLQQSENTIRRTHKQRRDLLVIKVECQGMAGEVSSVGVQSKLIEQFLH